MMFEGSIPPNGLASAYSLNITSRYSVEFTIIPAVQVTLSWSNSFESEAEKKAHTVLGNQFRDFFSTARSRYHKRVASRLFRTQGHEPAASPFQEIFSIMEQVSTDFWRENPRVKNSLLKPLRMTKFSSVGETGITPGPFHENICIRGFLWESS